MKNQLIILPILAAVIFIIVGSFLLFQKQTVGEIKPSYKYVTEKPTGWFKTGQEADLILYATGFNESGGTLVLNHPGKVATDGKRLIVSDTWNNRILIWNEIPTKNNQPPDLVLGQPDFNSNIGKLGADGMNWPMGVATDGKRLLVADAFNDRILIWNEFPVKNGQPADLVLGVDDFDIWQFYVEQEGSKRHEDLRDPTKRVDWPWDVWTNGEKIIVASTVDGSILIWNSFPTKNNQPADLILGYENFSTRFSQQLENPLADLQTPRSIASDGGRLVIGDYNARSAFVWEKFPTKNGQAADFLLQPRHQEDEEPSAPMGLALKDGRLYATVSHHVFIWNTFPENSNQKQDLKLGVQRTRDEYLIMPDKMIFYSDTFNSPYGVATDGKKLIIADTNNNRVLIFNEIPTEPDAKADVVIGTPDLFVSRNSYGSGPTPFSDGKRLIVGTDGFGVWIYNNLPDENKAEADVVVGKLLGSTVVGGHAITNGEKLIMVHREGSSVLIWNKIPEKDNELPDVILGAEVVLDNWGKPGKGRTGLNSPQMAATDGRSLFVTDTRNNRVLVWNEIPIKNQTPADFVLGQPDFDTVDPKPLPPIPENVEGLDLYGLDNPTAISSDGKKLAVIDGNHRVLIWVLPIKENDQRPDVILLGDIFQRNGPLHFEEPPRRWYHPSGVSIYGENLFITDGATNRVLIWNKLPTKMDDLPDLVLGQSDFSSRYPSNSRSNFAVFPFAISFDGSFLWVGEMKWSNRLLRFSVQPIK